jgi:Exostosin family
VQVHLLSAFPGPHDPDNFACTWLQESAQQDPFRKHGLTDNPNEADIIFFVEGHGHGDPYLLSVRRHPLYRRYPEKCFVYQDDDVAVAILRGIYPSIRRRDYLPDRCRSGGYIARIARNDSVCYDPSLRTRKWLYTFFGEANSDVRLALLAHNHPDGLVRDTTGSRLWQMGPGSTRAKFTKEYIEAILDSRFVLCPRGYGPSTYRLFETMEMGRVPVILSDEWVPPTGPQWNEFSVRVPEHLVGEVSSILREFSDRHEAMGQQARLAWEQWFAKPVCFHRLIELCVDIQQTPRQACSTLRAWGSLVRTPHLKNLLRPHYSSITRKLRPIVNKVARTAR